MLDVTNLVRTGTQRSYRDPHTAGSLWDLAFGSDSPIGDCGLALLSGLDPALPASVVDTAAYGPTEAYQRPTVSRVEVGGRTFYRFLVGYSEGYVVVYAATLGAAKAVLSELRKHPTFDEDWEQLG